jgi:ankyrin repeat protein
MRGWCGWIIVFTGVLASYGQARAPELTRAVQGGDATLVRSLLQRKADVNAREADGTTPLHWAVRADRQELIRMLLVAGADARAANRYGVTPLALASINGSESAVRLLLEAGADPNTTLAEGETALMRAARTGATGVIGALLDAGADANAAESWFGENALMWAAAENHPAAVQLLLDRGARVDARSAPVDFGELKYPSTGLVRMVLPRGQWTPLMYAAREGAADSVRVLARAGADLDAQDPDGVTPLVIAILNAHYDLAATLVDLGARPDVADSSGRAALYAAVDMHTLAPMFSRPLPKSSSTLNALSLAAKLLAAGADANLALGRPLPPRHHNPGDRNLGKGATAFMRAAQTADVAMMRLLLDAGANARQQQADGTTALMLAVAGRGGGDDDEGISSAASDASEAVRLCLAAGTDVNAATTSGDTALHRAVIKGNVDVVRILLEHGANPTTRNKRDQTPMTLAAGTGADSSAEIVRLLEAAAGRTR